MTCETCVFWEENPAAGGGNCRRYAPRPAEKSTPTNWPKTEANSWCGEWDEKRK